MESKGGGQVRLITINTGSKNGNAYLLKDSNGECLLLDAGVKEKDIKIALDFNITNLKGVCVSHNHLDHSLSADKFMRMGIKVFEPYKAVFHLDTPKTLNFGSYKVTSIPLTDSEGEFTHSNGDGSKCPVFGFLVEHKEMGKLLYLTDTEYCKYTFQGINHILIGTNYDEELINDEDKTKVFHVYTGHMSIQTACKTIIANKGSLQTITMCHLSDSNANAESFIKQVTDIVDDDVLVNVATRGLTVFLTKE